MNEYEHALVVDAPRDTVFDALMDIANLPRVGSVVQTATGESGDLVRVQASLLGRRYAIDTFIRVVDVFRRIEWAFGGDPSCTRWVQIDADDDAPASQVTAHVSILPDNMPGLSGQRVDALITDMLIASLASLQRVVGDRIPNEV